MQIHMISFLRQFETEIREHTAKGCCSFNHAMFKMMADDSAVVKVKKKTDVKREDKEIYMGK